MRMGTENCYDTSKIEIVLSCGRGGYFTGGAI
jgi:hypothetical protein